MKNQFSQFQKFMHSPKLKNFLDGQLKFEQNLPKPSLCRTSKNKSFENSEKSIKFFYYYFRPSKIKYILEAIEKSYEECSKSSKYSKKRQIILNNSPGRIIGAAKQLDLTYKKKSKLIENIEVEELERKLNQNFSAVSPDEAIKLKNEMGISTRQYSILLKFLRDKSPGLFPSLNKIKDRESEILPVSYLQTRNYSAELSFDHTIQTSILAIMAKNINSLKKYEISENSFKLNIDYCIKIGI